MNNEARAVTDPLHNTIYLLQGLCKEEESLNTDEIYDDAATVIMKPAMLIQSSEGEQTIFYYFRSVGWHNTMLITVENSNNRWEAFQCIRNPSNEQLSEIMKKGRQLI
jgi:hypothetical protein